MWFRQLCASAFLLPISYAKLQSRIIDDTNGDPATGIFPFYSPVNEFSLNSNCSSCKVILDPSQVHDRTWHDSSQNPGGSPVSIALSFTGVSISIFCILANFIDATTVSKSSFAFTMDGKAAATFLHTPSTSTDYIYNAKVFEVDGLDQSNHTVILSTNSASGSLLLFDFANYTFDDGERVGPDTTPSQSRTTSTEDRSRTQSVTITSIAVVTSNNTAPTSSLSVELTPVASSSSSESPLLSSATSPASTPNRKHLATILIAVLVPSLVLIACLWFLIRRYRVYRTSQDEMRAHPYRASGGPWTRLEDQSPVDARPSGKRRLLFPRASPARAEQGESPPDYASQVEH
ncbi:hypothetical protein C8F01DRAFT_1122391 [Mycena amicta]|nr:hypothetical protein C8F01DRAFT_1122391 [Mycena amicta]